MKLTKEYVRDLEERLEDANYECDKLGGNADATFDLRGEVSRLEMMKVEDEENWCLETDCPIEAAEFFYNF